MLTLTSRTYTKKINFKSPPTLEIAKIIYEEAEYDNLQDRMVTAVLHHYLKQKIRSGFVDKPGTYKLSVTVKFPIMFWHSMNYKIERL